MTTIGGLTPRGQRNAKKRSFEHSLSATAAKILKLEEERNIQKVRHQKQWWQGRGAWFHEEYGCTYVHVCCKHWLV